MYSYTYTYTDELLAVGKHNKPVALIEDIECELDIEVTVSHGEVEAIVTAVYINGWDLSDGTALTRQLAAAIIEDAQTNIYNGGYLWDEIVERNELVYHGRGAGDPDAYWSAA